MYIRGLLVIGVPAAVFWLQTSTYPNVSLRYVIPTLAAVCSQLLPLLVATPARLTTARKIILLWCAVFFAADVIQILLSRQFGANLWFVAASNPIEDAILLVGYSYWQSRPVLTLTFRVVAPLLLVTQLLIAQFAGEFDSYRAFSEPFRTLIVFAATAFTVVDRSRLATTSLLVHDWLWISMGVALYYGAVIGVHPIMVAIGTDGDLGLQVYFVKACADIVAFVLIARGMRCPVQAHSSGPT